MIYFIQANSPTALTAFKPIEHGKEFPLPVWFGPYDAIEFAQFDADIFTARLADDLKDKVVFVPASEKLSGPLFKPAEFFTSNLA